MESITGKISIKFILLDKDNWWRFYNANKHRLRPAIIKNVLKILSCGTAKLGYHEYTCNGCGNTHKVCHSCNSRFCNRCGKKAIENWVKTNFNIFPNTYWQHITFTLPKQLRKFLWVNRYLLNALPALAANVLQKLAKAKRITLGIMGVIHTFASNLKENVHFHFSTTTGGISFDQKRWLSFYFDHDSVKKMWRYAVISFLRQEYASGRLILPPELRCVRNAKAFNSWLNFLYQKKWYVNLQKKIDNFKRIIEYLGKYLKRPPLAESRIVEYDRKDVAFTYKDYKAGTIETERLPVMEFIGRLIKHIHDENFRMVRYYGFLANRVRGKMLEVAYILLKITNHFKAKVSIKWRDLFRRSCGIDPLLCKNCNLIMRLTAVTFAKATWYLMKNKNKIFQNLL